MKNVTGVMMYYYFVCKRKLWFFTNDITMERGCELVGMGKLIDEASYTRKKKNLLIDGTINIDFLKDWEVIHEVKKSRKLSEASRWQLKYYIWILKEKGVNIEKGILDYPLLRKREDVFLNEEDQKELKNILKEINKIIVLKTPPEIIKSRICKKCAYYEICYI